MKSLRAQSFLPLARANVPVLLGLLQGIGRRVFSPPAPYKTLSIYITAHPVPMQLLLAQNW
jgi:hypothetical protein